MNWFIEFNNSSIGRKIQVAAMGLLLCAYMVIHLFGNLFVYAGKGTFNHYAEVMESNPVLPAIEIALLGVFLCHISVALYSWILNRRARPQGYQAWRSSGGQTLSGKAMTASGLVLLTFLGVHVRVFRFADRGDDLYGLETATLASKPLAVFYLLALAALFPHLQHGFQSAFNTLGVNHPKLNSLIKPASSIFAAVIVTGFASIVVYISFLQGGRP